MDIIEFFIFLIMFTVYVNIGVSAAKGLDESKIIKFVTAVAWPLLLLIGLMLKLQVK